MQGSKVHTIQNGYKSNYFLGIGQNILSVISDYCLEMLREFAISLGYSQNILSCIRLRCLA